MEGSRPTTSLRIFAGKLLAGAFIFLAGITSSLGQESPCSITTNPAGGQLNVLETTPVNQTIFTFIVVDGAPASVSMKPEQDLNSLLSHLELTYDPDAKSGIFAVNDTLEDLPVDELQETVFTDFNLACVADDGQETLSDLEPIRLLVLDGNDNPPVFSQDSYEFTIPEDFPLSFDISIGGTPVSTSDADKETNNTAVVYTIVDDSSEQLAAKHFSVTRKIVDAKNSEAVITLIRALDFETVNVFNFEVLANNTNEADPYRPVQTAEVEIRINVADAFDQPLNFKNPVYTVVIDNPDVSQGDSVAVIPGPIEFVNENITAYGGISYSFMEPTESQGIPSNYFKVEPSGNVVFSGNSFEELVETANGQATFVALLKAEPEVNSLFGTSAIFQVVIDTTAITTNTPEVTTLPSDETTSVALTSDSSSLTTSEATTPTFTDMTVSLTSSDPTGQTLTSGTATFLTSSDATSGQTFTDGMPSHTTPLSSDGPSYGTTTSPSDTTIYFEVDSASGSIKIHPAMEDQPVFVVKAKSTDPNGDVRYKLERDSSGNFAVGDVDGVVRAVSFTQPGVYDIAVMAYLAGNGDDSNTAEVSPHVSAASPLFEKRLYTSSIRESDLTNGAEVFTIPVSSQESSTMLQILGIELGKDCSVSGSIQDMLKLTDEDKIVFNGETGAATWHSCPTGIYAKIGEKEAGKSSDDMLSVGSRETVFWLNILDVNNKSPRLTAAATGQDAVVCDSNVAETPRAELHHRSIRSKSPLIPSHPQRFNDQPRIHQRATCDETLKTAFLSKNVDWRMPYPGIAEFQLEDEDSSEETSFMLSVKGEQDGSKFALQINDDTQNLGRVSGSLVPKELLDCKEVCLLTIQYSDDKESQTRTHELRVEVAVLEPQNLMFFEMPSDQPASAAAVIDFLEEQLAADNSDIDFGILFAQTHKPINRGRSRQKAAFQTTALVYGLHDDDTKRPATYDEMKQSLNTDGISDVQVQNFTAGMVIQVTEVTVNESTDDGGKIAAIVMGVIMALLIAACAVFLYKKKIANKNRRTPGNGFKEHRDTLKIRDSPSATTSINGSLGRKNDGFLADGGTSGDALGWDLSSSRSQTDGPSGISPATSSEKRPAPPPPAYAPPASAPPPSPPQPPPVPPRMSPPMMQVTKAALVEKIPAARQVSFTEDPPKQIPAGSRRVSFADEMLPKMIPDDSIDEDDDGAEERM